MLTPRYLDGLSDELIEIYSQLESDILQDMARRLSRVGKITEATKWQARMLSEAGGIKGSVSKILKKYDKTIREQIIKTVTEALETSVKTDNRIFLEATGRTVSSPDAQAMLSLIQKCHSDLSRLTLTTASTSQNEFVKQANRVYMNVQNGAFDYDTAMKDACDELSKRGITTVQYENGKPVTRTIESAVRMNILTSINQSAANMSLNNAEELGVEKFEVSAHAGARPEHEAWQGKVYTKQELYEICGLGDVTGLCGINCRHSFYPYFDGMETHYTQDDLDEMAGEKVSYNGHEMTRYEAEQRERQIERNIRHYKRQALTQEAGGVDSTRARQKLGEWQAAARDFTRQTGIARDSAREYVGTSGKQPTGITLGISDTVAKAQKLFPEDTFSKVDADIYASDTRKVLAQSNKQEEAKFKKEIEQARIFGNYGHKIVLVAENKAGKNYDAIMDKGQSLELKTITGSLSSVEKRFGEALNQGDNVFLRISQDFSAHEVYIKLRNVLLSHPRTDGDVYVYLEKQKKMYRWKMRNIT